MLIVGMWAAMHVLIHVGMYSIQSLKWGGVYMSSPHPLPPPPRPFAEKNLI